MNDHAKLMVALIGNDESKNAATATVGDVVSMLYELGALHRDPFQQRLVLTAGR